MTLPSFRTEANPSAYLLRHATFSVRRRYIQFEIIPINGYNWNMQRISSLLTLTMGICLLPFHLQARSRDARHTFAEFPACGLSQTPCFPTVNSRLSDFNTVGFAAQTRDNDQYGLPGWTRGRGARFHKGVDIVPLEFETTSQTVQISYSDPKTHRDYSEDEPVLIPKDRIFAILDGQVVVANDNPKRSGYGCYVIVEHRFADGTSFVSMYAHLNRLEVREGDWVSRGHCIGWMGQTSSNPDGRRYLMAIPHCHFEVGRIINPQFVNAASARQLSPAMLGGNYDPRNIQPYNPVAFLRLYRAQPFCPTTLTQLSPAHRPN